MDNLTSKDNLQVRNPNNKAAWKNYRDKVKTKTRRTKLNTEPEYNEVIRECLKTIAHLWSNSTGGVYVKDLGYFTLLRPTKKFQKRDSKEYINNIYRTHGYSYLLTHITSLKTTDGFGGFKLRRVAIPIKKDTRVNILKGRRYTINSTLIKEYIKRKTYL